MFQTLQPKLKRTYSYGGISYANPHALTSIASTNYTYDNNGNLTSDGTWTHTYNYDNRLTQSSKTGTTVTYAYDPNGQRIKQNNGTTTTIYPTKYYNKEGSTDIKHIYLPAQAGIGDTLIATVRGTGTNAVVSYIHTDHLNSTDKVTNTNAEISELSDYYPYGSPRISTQYSGTTEQRKYIGQEYDTSTNLSYLNARYYDSNRGMFISQDPVFWALGNPKILKSLGVEQNAVLRDPQMMNSYSYANGNPIVNKDPTGKAFVIDDAIGFVGGGLVGAGVYALSSAIGGENISWSGASGAFVTGGIIGWGAINTPATLGASNAISASVIAGLTGGFYGNLTKQVIDIGTGKQTGGLNHNELQTSGLVTAGTNVLLGAVLPNTKISGISAGRGNMNAVGQAVRTKADNGMINNMSFNTAIKSTIGSQAADLYRTSVGGIVDSIKSFTNNNKKTK